MYFVTAYNLHGELHLWEDPEPDILKKIHLRRLDRREKKKTPSFLPPSSRSTDDWRNPSPATARHSKAIASLDLIRFVPGTVASALARNGSNEWMDLIARWRWLLTAVIHSP